MLNLIITPAEHKAIVSLMRKLQGIASSDQIEIKESKSRLQPKKSKAEIKKSALNELQKACPTIQPFLKK